MLNPSDDPLSWRYTTDDITDTWWEPGTSWPTALTVANDTAYLLGRNVSHTIVELRLGLGPRWSDDTLSNHESSCGRQGGGAILGRIPTAALLRAGDAKWSSLEFWVSATTILSQEI